MNWIDTAEQQHTVMLPALTWATVTDKVEENRDAAKTAPYTHMHQQPPPLTQLSETCAVGDSSGREDLSVCHLSLHQTAVCLSAATAT